MEKNKEKYIFGDILLKILEDNLDIHEDDFVAWKVTSQERDPFKILVAIILSQNTIEKNTLRAYIALNEKIGVSPSAIYETNIDLVKEAIRIAGLQDSKAKAIKLLAKKIIEDLGGDSYKLYKLNADAIRNLLDDIPGIGRKTIDVFLANIGYPILPIDTHIKRVSYRIGLTNHKVYIKIQQDLHTFFRPESRLKAHMYLIKLGRVYCKAISPRCDLCPLRNYCLKRIK